MTTNIEYTIKETNEKIVENVLKMLERRKLINSALIEFDKLKKEFDKSIYQILLENKTTCDIYIINAKISTISNGSQLDEYLSNNIDIHKIVVIRDFSKKFIKDVISDYKNVELFFMYEMMEDIPDKIFISNHRIINNNEKVELLSKFNENELSKILISDKMSRYYGAKLGDIFKITRPSFTAGRNILYRKVINGSWDILF
jgi:DNA-directed RNA polymerase I, II, and III subunit RPABC1